MRLSGVLLGLVAVMAMGATDCPDPDCPDPAEGLLTPGVWGGENWQLDVDPEGMIRVHTYCASGSSQEPVFAENGYVAFGADMIFEFGGPGRPGEARFDGRVCGDTFEFTYMTDYGYTEEAVVTFGTEGRIEPCPYL